MSVMTAQPAAADTGTEIAVIRSWKVPIAFAVFTVLLGLLLLLAPRDGVTTFRISGGNDPVQVPEIQAPVALVTWGAFIILAGILWNLRQEAQDGRNVALPEDEGSPEPPLTR